MDTFNQENMAPTRICSLSDAGCDGLNRPAVQEMSTRQRASNCGQRFQLHTQRYEGRNFTGISCHVEGLLDSGNTTSPGVAISEQLTLNLGLAIVPYNTQVKNVDGGICSILGTVAPKSLTISFSTSEKETNEFEDQPLVLKHIQDHVNIGI